MIIVGLDLSLNSAGMCIYNSETNKTFIYVFTNKIPKKFKDTTIEFQDFSINIIRQMEHTKDYQERFHNLKEQIFNTIRSHSGEEKSWVYIEDYAHSMIRNTTISVIELSGIIKMDMWYDKENYEFNEEKHLIVPSSLKKLIGGKGNLKKRQIYECGWNREIIQNLLTHLEEFGYTFKDGCWQEDMLDAWAVCEFGKIQNNLNEN